MFSLLKKLALTDILCTFLKSQVLYTQTNIIITRNSINDRPTLMHIHVDLHFSFNCIDEIHVMDKVINTALTFTPIFSIGLSAFTSC